MFLELSPEPVERAVKSPPFLQSPHLSRRGLFPAGFPGHCPLSTVTLKPGPTKAKSRKHTRGLCGRTPGSPGQVSFPDAAQVARPWLAWTWSKLPSLQDQKTAVTVTSSVLDKTALQGFKEGLHEAAACTCSAHTDPHSGREWPPERGLPQSQQHGCRTSSAETEHLYRGRSRVRAGLGSSLALAAALC